MQCARGLTAPSSHHQRRSRVLHANTFEFRINNETTIRFRNRRRYFRRETVRIVSNVDMASPTLTGRRVFFEFQNDRGSGELMMSLRLHLVLSALYDGAVRRHFDVFTNDCGRRRSGPAETRVFGRII